MSEIYKQLLEEELKPKQNSDIKPSKKKIGQDKISFAKEEHFFHSDSISSKAKDAKQQIKTLINPDRLKMSEREWINSVYIDPKLKHHDKVIGDVNILPDQARTAG